MLDRILCCVLPYQTNATSETVCIVLYFVQYVRLAILFRIKSASVLSGIYAVLLTMILTIYSAVYSE